MRLPFFSMIWMAMLLAVSAAASPVDFPAPVLAAGSIESTATSLTVSWTDNSLETGFILQYQPVGVVDWIQHTPSPAANVTSATLTGLQPATEYVIRIQATSPAASSPWSNTLVMHTLNPPPPAFNRISYNGWSVGLYLSFTSSLTPDSIVVERATSADGPWTLLGTLPGNSSSYGDLNIRTDVTYFYRLQSRWGSLGSDYVIQSGILPGPNLSLSAWEYYGRVIVSGSTDSGYFTAVIQRRQGEAGPWENLPGYSPPDRPYSSSYTDSSTVAGATYHYRLKALPESVTDKVSNIVSVTMPEQRPDTFFDGLKITDISASHISLAWPDVGLETGWRIERRNSFYTNWMHLATLGADATSYTDTTVVEAHSYEYRAMPFNVHGFSPRSPTGSGTALEMAVTLEDDFDPELDVGQWTSTSVSTSVDGGTGFNGTKALWFGHFGRREAVTRPVDASGGGLIKFSLRAGNSRDGTQYWANPDEYEYLSFSCSSDGITWHSLALFSLHEPKCSDWAEYVFLIPAHARSKTLRFRWRHDLSASFGLTPWALDNVRVRSYPDDIIIIHSPPFPRVFKAGTPAGLNVRVNQPDATYQWYKDGELIPGATQATYGVASAEPAHGGSYTCVIRHGEKTLTTQPVMLGVIEPAGAPGPIYTRVGESFSLGMRVYPASLESSLSLAWMRTSEGDLAGIGTVSGEQTSTLAVTGATTLAEATYQCRVTYEMDQILWPLDVGPYEVRLLRRSVIQPLPDVDVVSGSPVDIAISASYPPVFIQVRDLPKGLSYDAATQRIVGSITGNKSYTITVDANNPLGAAVPVKFQLNVVGFPAALAGTYRGVFTDRDADPAYRYGAQTAFKITTKGAASGTVMIRGKNRRFVSKNVAAAPDGAWGRLEAAFEDPEGSPLHLEVDIVGGAALHEAVLLTGGDGEPQILTDGHAVRNDWSKANPAPSAGLINAALLSPVLVDGVTSDTAGPRGVGFLNLKLTPQGIVTCKGRLADGQAVTGSTLMGPEGHMPVFVSLYRGTGGFGTLMTYSPSGQAGGRAWWGKEDQGPSSKDRVHRSGFIRNSLSVEGGLYQRPAANSPLFASQVDVPTPATLTLTRALLPDSGITQPFSFTGKHQADVPREPALNPYGITLKLKAATGTFTGKFKLADPNPLKSGATLRRTVTFQGSLIPGLERGYGYFLLPELPSAEIPRNPPMWSGRVEILPAEVE